MERMTRIAIIDTDKCKPNKCHQECKKNCPVERVGKLCIDVTLTSKVAVILEQQCIGCNICVKKCPFNAISMINLPKNLEKDTSHRYGPNGFKLHRLPTPRRGSVLGLVGSNACGKSTCLKLLAAKLTPNLGKAEKQPTWAEIITHYRGSELQNYFRNIVDDKYKVLVKPQYVDLIARSITGTVEDILTRKDDTKTKEHIIRELQLGALLNRDISVLAGGELQRFAIGTVCIQQADVYMFDEPSSYLDIKQRLYVAKFIRSMRINKYCMVVEHDLSVLDYLSDFICCLYGQPGAYGSCNITLFW